MEAIRHVTICHCHTEKGQLNKNMKHSNKKVLGSSRSYKTNNDKNLQTMKIMRLTRRRFCYIFFVYNILEEKIARNSLIGK